MVVNLSYSGNQKISVLDPVTLLSVLKLIWRRISTLLHITVLRCIEMYSDVFYCMYVKIVLYFGCAFVRDGQYFW